MNNYFKSEKTMEETCLILARLFANCRSKDPDTKVGAVVYDPDTGGLFFGYNGFPRNYPDNAEIWKAKHNEILLDVYGVNHGYITKYNFVVHAEANAIRKAMMALNSSALKKCVLYCTNKPCGNCMKDFIVPSGIKKIIYYDKHPNDVVTDELARFYSIEIKQVDEKSYPIIVIPFSEEDKDNNFLPGFNNEKA